jgi:hypothetical protein
MRSVLTSRQRIAAKKVARKVIGSPAHFWSDIGEDGKDAKVKEFLQRLRETDNCTITGILTQNKELAFYYSSGEDKFDAFRKAEEC